MDHFIGLSSYLGEWWAVPGLTWSAPMRSGYKL